MILHIQVLTDLVQDVWLPRRTISKTAQVHVPLCDANTALASCIPKGEFSKIAEDSAAVIAFEATPQGSSFYQVRKNALLYATGCKPHRETNEC